MATTAAQSAYDHMLTGILILDDQLHVRSINNAAEHLLHTSAAHAINLHLERLLLRSETLLEQLASAIELRQPFTLREATLYLPDSVAIEVDLGVSVMEATQNNPQLLLELQPLNRLKRINKDDESVARQETARRLIRGLAHEIKNPLGGIRGAAQLLDRELATDELKEYTSVVISEADRLTDLVDRMLGPQQQLKFSDVNILKVCEHIISLLEAEQPGLIQWRRDYDPSVPNLRGDESQLIQAVLNIVRNAREALAATQEPRIGLRTRIVRQFTIGAIRHRLVLQLEIIDNGPGIDPELQERIFFPMISGRHDGTGLGLAITQNIVAQHQGSIQFSTRPGHTCFSIYLPIDDKVDDKIDNTQTVKPRKES